MLFEILLKLRMEIGIVSTRTKSRKHVHSLLFMKYQFSWTAWVQMNHNSPPTSSHRCTTNPSSLCICHSYLTTGHGSPDTSHDALYVSKLSWKFLKLRTIMHPYNLKWKKSKHLIKFSLLWVHLKIHLLNVWWIPSPCWEEELTFITN